MRAGNTIGFFALILALISAIPAAAAFTPAVLFSLLALLIAAAAAVLGAVRLSLLTMLIVAITVFVVSPMTSLDAIDQEPRILWVLVLPFSIYAVSLVIGWRNKATK